MLVDADGRASSVGSDSRPSADAPVRYLASLPVCMGPPPGLGVGLTEAAGRSADRRAPGRADKRSPAAEA